MIAGNTQSPDISRKWKTLLLALTLCFLGARLWHIRADFPDYGFYSQEHAKFTDEGFYTSAALNYYTAGRVYIPGGWNPGVFMPVWPLLVGLAFHFTGISVVAARSLAVLCTWLTILLAYAIARQYRSHSFALFTVLLAATNALGFFYSRLAILEPAFVLFLLLAIFVAGEVRTHSYGLAFLVGILFTFAALTKTTALFLLPAVLYPIWASNREDRSAAWKLIAASLTIIVVMLGAVKIFWGQHYSVDSQMILPVAFLWRLQHSPLRLVRFFLRGTWIDPVLFPIALAGSIAAIMRLRFLWRDTLFVISFLWEAGYAAFIVFHHDGPPRYFVVLIIPTIWLALIFMQWLWREQRAVAMVFAACIVICIGWSVAYIGIYLAHPRYTLVDASVGIRSIIDAHPNTSPLLIGHGADEVSLLSGGLPTMESDGAMLLADKIDVYHPGWFMRWSGDEPKRFQSMKTKRHLVERAKFYALDPIGQTTITLYQLMPKTDAAP